MAAIGELVDVDNETEEARRADRARVLICMPWSPAIHHIVNVDIGGGECTRCMWWRNLVEAWTHVIAGDGGRRDRRRKSTLKIVAWARRQRIPREHPAATEMNGMKAQKPPATPSVDKAQSVEVSTPLATKIHGGVLTSS